MLLNAGDKQKMWAWSRNITHTKSNKNFTKITEHSILTRASALMKTAGIQNGIYDANFIGFKLCQALQIMDES
jgi:hypothetical protein